MLRFPATLAWRNGSKATMMRTTDEHVLFVDFHHQFSRLASIHDANDGAGGDNNDQLVERLENHVVARLCIWLPNFEMPFEIDDRRVLEQVVGVHEFRLLGRRHVDGSECSLHVVATIGTGCADAWALASGAGRVEKVVDANGVLLEHQQRIASVTDKRLPHFEINPPISGHGVGGRDELSHRFPPEREQISDLLPFRIDHFEALIAIQKNGLAGLFRYDHRRNEAPCGCRARGLAGLASNGCRKGRRCKNTRNRSSEETAPRDVTGHWCHCASSSQGLPGRCDSRVGFGERILAGTGCGFHEEFNSAKTRVVAIPYWLSQNTRMAFWSACALAKPKAAAARGTFPNWLFSAETLLP